MSPSQAASAAPRSNLTEYSVSDLSFAIKGTLESAYGHVRVRGEISGYRGPHASGHCYFALKDDKAKIEAVIWRGVFQALRFKPAEGLEVIATGRLTTYPGSSKYQVVIEALEPAGAGALMALLEERKKKLAADGLFAEERKKKLPFLPRVVGIITSPTGAVIRDMLHGFNERFPTHVVVWPVRVQGESCAPEVTAALQGFNRFPDGGPLPRPDVIIVARGGGSLEDLWGFNEESVVRATAASAIPVIAAVGHETDWTLIDLAADARAPTPTKAAEWAVPKRSELLERTAEMAGRMRLAARRRLESERERHRGLARALPRLQDLVALPRQRFDGAAGRLRRALMANTQAHAHRLARTSGRLNVRLLQQRVVLGRERMANLGRLGVRAMRRGIDLRRLRLERVAPRLRPATLAAELRRSRTRLGELAARGRQAHANLRLSRTRLLDSQSRMLGSLGYRSVLARGFAMVRDEAGRMLRSVAAVGAGMRLDIELADGRIGATAEAPPGPRSGGGAGPSGAGSAPLGRGETGVPSTGVRGAAPDAAAPPGGAPTAATGPAPSVPPRSPPRLSTAVRPKSDGSQGSLF